MSIFEKHKFCAVLMLTLFSFAMLPGSSWAKNVKWVSKKLEFVTDKGRSCLKISGYYENTSDARVITGINKITFTWKQMKEGDAAPSSKETTFENPPFPKPLKPGEKSDGRTFTICRFGKPNEHYKVRQFKSGNINYNYKDLDYKSW